MKLYYFLGRLLRWPLTAGFFLYCVILKTPRVRVVVRNERGELLLIQTWLSGDEWSFPGGGVGAGETYEEAAVRELKEETGIVVTSGQLKQVGFIRGWGHDEPLFTVEIPSDALPQTLPSPFEVKVAQWHADTAQLRLGSLARQIMAKVATNH